MPYTCSSHVATLQHIHPQRLGLLKPLQVTWAGKAPTPQAFPPRTLHPLSQLTWGLMALHPLQLDSVSSHLLLTLLDLFFLPH